MHNYRGQWTLMFLPENTSPKINQNEHGTGEINFDRGKNTPHYLERAQIILKRLDYLRQDD